MLGVIHERGQLRHFGPDLIGDGTPLGAGGLGCVLGESGGDEGRDHPSTALPGMGKGIALEVDAAALPCGAENLGDGGLDALMGVRDHQLHAPQPTPGEFTQELGPDRIGLGRACFQNQNLAPPSVFTPMAMMTATETIRPRRRTLR